jgi:hypothetical protein
MDVNRPTAERPTTAYDGAPRAITHGEAIAIAAGEYDYHGTTCLHRGADGGMHFNQTVYSEGAARGWAGEKRRALVRKIMRGDARHTVFYDRARDRFYCG